MPFRRRRERPYVMAADVIELDLPQTIRLLSYWELYERVPLLKPILWAVVTTACSANKMVSQGQGSLDVLRQMYERLQLVLLTRIRTVLAEGNERQLKGMKAIVKSRLQVDAKKLLFRCPAPDGTVYNVLV